MLTESQAGRIWQEMFEAEVRAMYFGDLTSKMTRRRQIISGLSLFLSSGAAATIAVTRLPSWIPLIMAAFVAALTAYSIALNLERAIATSAKLHSEWNRLSIEFERLWYNWHRSDAEERLQQLQSRAQEASLLGTEAPYKEKLFQKWDTIVRTKYAVPATT